MATLDRDLSDERPEDTDPALADAADAFCRLACLVYSEKDGPERWAAARSILADSPELPGRSMAAAAAAADPGAIGHHLSGDPGAAGRSTGPHRWPPLLYLAYSRVHPPSVPADRFMACARLLMDAGADPDAGYLWRGLTPPFTALTGIFGEGEQGPGRQPRHPHEQRLARLLLEAGADPDDRQALYNRMFRPDNGHLILLFEHGLGRPGAGVWERRLGGSIETIAEMWARELSWALDHGFDDRVRLLIANGVHVTAAFPDGSTPAQRAIRSGRVALLDDLRRAGATIPELDDLGRLTGRLLDPDRPDSAADPVLLAALRRRRPALIHHAVTPSAVAAIARAGFDVDARSDGRTALHEAAFAGDIALIAALLEAGADPAMTDDLHHGTPAQWAAHAYQHAAVAMLEQLT